MTSAYIHNFYQLPVYSCDISEVHYEKAKHLLRNSKNVHLYLQDSRDFLKDLSNKPELNGNNFFYLDAHGSDDLPLLEAMQTIASSWNNYVIMIDDFMVDGTKYRYDTYGDKILNLRLLKEVMDEHSLVAYFPSTPYEEETCCYDDSQPRGSVTLVKNGPYIDILNKTTSLRKA